jgi:hypothetical protein
VQITFPPNTGANIDLSNLSAAGDQRFNAKQDVLADDYVQSKLIAGNHITVDYNATTKQSAINMVSEIDDTTPSTTSTYSSTKIENRTIDCGTF